MYLGKAHTNSNIAWHRPMSSTFRIDEELMQSSSRALVHATDPLEKLRLMCLMRGVNGIMGLARTFRLMDEYGTKRLNKEEFVNGIKEAGLELSTEDLDQLFSQFDADNRGSIDLAEFLVHVRPPMSDYRKAIVQQAFNKLDKTGDGVIHIEAIRKIYEVTSHPRYMSGEESADIVMDRFMANFEKDSTLDGNITLEEFMNYYSSISVSIDNDCYFDLMMRQAYKL